VTQSYEETRRPSAAVTGAVIGGAVAVIAGLLWKFKAKRAADEDSPILIKGGSLSVSLHEDYNLSISQGNAEAYTITAKVLRRKSWNVVVARLEAGFPVSAEPFFRVTQVTLTLVKDNGDVLDHIAITRTPGVLTLAAETDNHFGRDVKERVVKKSHKHKRRAYHKEVGGEKDFDIAEVALVSGGTSYSLTDGPEYVLAFDYID
jgi:hypothetical protein